MEHPRKPIPLRVPKPEEVSAEYDPHEQLKLNQRKTDEALRACAEMAQRVGAMEELLNDTLNNKLFEFEQKFDSMMGQRMKEQGEQFDAMKRTVSDTLSQNLESLLKRVEETIAANKPLKGR
jgi:hypothetical protein